MDINKLPKIVEKAGETGVDPDIAIKQYDPALHAVMDPLIRKKKEVKKPSGSKDEAGNDIMETNFEEVNRIAIPFQKLIVKRRVAFMNVGNIQVMAKPEGDDEERLVEMVKKIREDNKLRFKENEVARRMLSELQCAKLWYSERLEGTKGKEYWGDLVKKGGEFRMRLKILSPEQGDTLLPVFDSFGNLIYFGRIYKAMPSLDTIDEDETKYTEKEHFDIYTDTQILRFEKGKEGWVPSGKPVAHSYGKIPIIYYSVKETPWNDVQPIISRIEEVISNFGDTNDYNGSPILTVTGDITGFSAKGERGKVLQLQDGAKVEYVTWDRAPESIKLEIDTLIEMVYTCTQTPNISFKEMAGLGAKSGVAFDRVFMDAQLAAQAMIDDVYGECTQREINFLKSACAAIDSSLQSVLKLDIWADIPVFRINDNAETVNMLTAATGGKPVISQESAIAMSGLTDDPEEEWERIKAEEDTLGREIGEGL